MLTFSIDCMGGDHGPQPLFEAAKSVLDNHLNLRIKFFVDKSSELDLSSLNKFKDRIEIKRCETFLRGDQDLRSILRDAKNSTMYMALQSVANKESDAVFTVGHTGPYFILAKKVLGSFDELSRLPLAVFIPSVNGHKVLTDIGANLECSEHDLCKFGLLGQQLIKSVLNIENPGVSLINVGHEETKGTSLLKNTAQILQNKIGNSFKGFIDADQIFTCEADVIVTDGFSGNCISKACEGTSRFIMSKFKKYWIVEKLINLFTYNADRYNGAILLGTKGISIKAHGSSKIPSLINALNTTYKFASQANILLDNLNSVDFSTN